jgi:TrmH family RNA methyltransferase
MVSKNQIKLITSLQQKKYRKQEGLFIAEGKKIIQELVDAHYQLQHVFTTSEKFASLFDANKSHLISENDLKKISALTTANDALAIFEIPESNTQKTNGITVVLDDIRDPGNFGTIIRLCDWFGIENLVCSIGTVDVYNPKVVQATMGSISRVNIIYTNLVDYLSENTLPVYGTFMDGDNIYEQKLAENAILIMGNEANGISDLIAQKTTHKITIPRFGNNQKTESLNVATATAIILSEFKRNV